MAERNKALAQRFAKRDNSSNILAGEVKKFLSAPSVAKKPTVPRSSVPELMGMKPTLKSLSSALSSVEGGASQKSFAPSTQPKWSPITAAGDFLWGEDLNPARLLGGIKAAIDEDRQAAKDDRSFAQEMANKQYQVVLDQMKQSQIQADRQYTMDMTTLTEMVNDNQRQFELALSQLDKSDDAGKVQLELAKMQHEATLQQQASRLSQEKAIADQNYALSLAQLEYQKNQAQLEFDLQYAQYDSPYGDVPTTLGYSAGYYDQPNSAGYYDQPTQFVPQIQRYSQYPLRSSYSRSKRFYSRKYRRWFDSYEAFQNYNYSRSRYNIGTSWRYNQRRYR
jgi:hypothetical protein